MSVRAKGRWHDCHNHLLWRAVAGWDGGEADVSRVQVEVYSVRVQAALRLVRLQGQVYSYGLVGVPLGRHVSLLKAVSYTTSEFSTRRAEEALEFRCLASPSLQVSSCPIARDPFRRFPTKSSPVVLARRYANMRVRVIALALALVQSSSALVLTGLRAPTVRGRSGVGQLQARLSEEEGGACIILEDADVQQ